MNNTLIAYASDHGTAEKCAHRLFNLMEGNVDICNLKHREIFPDVSSYNTVIIGGSILSSVIQNVVSAFCAQNVQVLATKRLGLFVNCAYSGEKAQRQLDAAFPAALNQKALVREYFGGEINRSKLNFWERIVISQMMEKEDLVVALSKDKITRFAQIMSHNEQ